DTAQQQATSPQAGAQKGEAEPGADSTDDVAALFDDRGNLKLGQPKAIFKSFKETSLKPVELKKNVKIANVYTPNHRDPSKEEGRAYLYLLPQGFGERAIIHLSDGGDNYYSLVVHPLTGRVVVQSGYVEIPRDFDRRDDEGNLENER